MKPKQLKIIDKSKLKITWQNGEENFVGLKYMREQCPCALCKGETILLKSIKPAKLNVSFAEMFEVQSMEVVGGYALKVVWKDGHDTGFYTWEYLKTLSQDEDSGKSQNYEPLL